MLNVKHIFFDLDHTLWDFDKNSALSFQQIFEEEHIEIDYETFIKAYSPVNFKYWKLYREEKISKEDLRYSRLKDTFEILNYTVEDDLIHIIANNYISYLPNYNHLIEGSIELLDYLKDKYQLHIITNGFKEVQYSKLKKSHIFKYFDHIVTADCVGVKKPNPKVFKYALDQVNSKPEDCVMIGDSYEADVMGAFSVGMLPIHFDLHKTNSSNGILNVSSLLSLKQYI